MVTETTIAGIRAHLADHRECGERVAFVPTMGALHDGHIALVTAACKLADVVAVSIFVNPLQFGPSEDYSRYPRTLERDSAKLAAAGASLLFAPAAAEMYAEVSRTTVMPPTFAEVLEGDIRPGHFAGVLTVVSKLFNIMEPAAAVFGRKDLQQLSLIRAMVTDLNFPIEIHDVETVREPDGLALSSRNRYLDDDARRRATRLRAALVAAKAAFDSGVTDPAAVEATGTEVLSEDQSITVDYFALVNEPDFETPAVAKSGNSIVSAVRVGGTRLLDNIRL